MDHLNLSAEQLAHYSKYKRPEISFVYELTPELNSAVEVALSLNQPLLLTGEPGTGKTTLAEKVASDLYQISGGAYRSRPYTFNTKSTSVFTDLFYSYDAMSHYYDVNIKKESKPDIKNYIELNALGSAIAASLGDNDKKMLPARNVPEESTPKNAVVLIDEIDKASRDFPNDLLNELENFCFTIKEAGTNVYAKDPESKILIIFTSNNEKELPEAFLRRCIYYNIDFPDDNFLKIILTKHELMDQLDGKASQVLKHFRELRSICRNKMPATAELISWCRIIVQRGLDVDNKKALLDTLPIVVKHRDDLSFVKEKWMNG